MFSKTMNLTDTVLSITAGLDGDLLESKNVIGVRSFAKEHQSAKLQPQSVINLFLGCMYQDGEATDASKYVPAMGEQTKTGFNPERIDEATPAIQALLYQLPDQFFAHGFNDVECGGGYVFTNACNNWHGELWTGLHAVMDMLFCLGIASGIAVKMLADLPMPPEMSYYAILPEKSQPELKTKLELMGG